MKKKWLILLCAILACLCAAFATTGCDDKKSQPTEGLEYSLSADKTSYTVTGVGLVTDSNIVIASAHNGLPVTEIAGGVFQECVGLTSIVIPESITSIGAGAFANCYKLKEVYNLSSLTIELGSTENGYVGYYAKDIYTSLDEASRLITTREGYVFYNDNGNYFLLDYVGQKAQITLPKNINGNNYVIHSLAFYGRNGLTSIVIPDSITSIGDMAFFGCSGLTSVTIGDAVTSINNNAFRGCSNLTSVTFGENCQLTDIGETFYGCSGLTSIVIPNSVTSIDSYAFYGCSSLTSVSIGNSVTSIGDYAFSGSGLMSIVIPDSVESIGDSAFRGCSLNTVTIGNGVTDIGWYAFYNCTGLTTVTIGNSVENFGYEAFYGCEALSKVNYMGTIDGWAMIEFGNDNANPLYYAKKLYINNSEVTKVSLTTATYITDGAFYNCINLTDVTIGSSVTRIGTHAFYGCSSLTSVTFQSPSEWRISLDNLTTDEWGIRLTNPSANATCLTSTYYNYYWRRN